MTGSSLPLHSPLLSLQLNLFHPPPIPVQEGIQGNHTGHTGRVTAKLHIDVGNAPLLPALFRYECLPWKQKDHKFPMFAFGMASVPARGMDRTRKAWEGNVKVSQLWWVHRHFKSSAPFDQLWKVTLFYLLGTRNSSLWMLMSLILYFWTIHYSSNKM